jgi:catechol 2,3-dioxygenase-like lactoylglutathione lyase family enzyme
MDPIMLKTRGLNHIDLGTKDMAATRAFYEDVLGFPVVRADLVEIGDDGALLGFMSRENARRYASARA